ncbi:MAG: purine-nucleoside phosphorylase [Maricaulis sp.]|nr:purine-nucleoside phosphorylase [Maricaulis sp.]
MGRLVRIHSRETNSATQQVCEQFTRHIGDNPTKATPVKFDIAIVLGSGLGAFTDNLPNPLTLPYETLPGFPDSGVTSHAGVLIVCQLWNKNVLVFAGREHFYEHGSADAMAPAIDLIADLGCKTLILTNAAGSLRKETGPGELVLIRDHINFSGKNPLIGADGDDRFVDLSNAYDSNYRACALEVARRAEIPLSEGVYMWFSGPSFETPAETRAARILGADLVGMSTVPEVILARRRGLRVTAFSVVTNLGADLSAQHLSHDHTRANARLGAAQLMRLLPPFIEEISS